MTRPKKCRVTIVVDQSTLFAAKEALHLRRPSDVITAGLLTVLGQRSGRRPNRAVFVPVFHLDSIGILGVVRLLRTGYAVALAHKGRLRTYKPDTLRAARLERKLLTTVPTGMQRLAHVPASCFTPDEWQALVD